MASLTLRVSRPLCLKAFFWRAVSPYFLNKCGDKDLISPTQRSESVFGAFLSRLIGEQLPSSTVDLFVRSGILLAVPKKRVSHSRKRIRNFPKFPKVRTDIEVCVVCRNEKLRGHLCGYCLEGIRKETEEVQAKWPSYDLPQPMSK